MRMVKRNPFLSGALAILGGVCLLAGTATADVTSDNAAGIVVFPKLVLDTSGGIDTEIQLTNTSNETVYARCFYVNANSHCSDDPTDVCIINEDCTGLGAICIPGWIEIDFNIKLTALQPTIWTIGDGRIRNGIPAVPEDPFRGELKCIQVGEDQTPVDRNDLKGEATIVTASSSELDARGYNALGIQAREGANNGDNTLVLGEEYNGCPNILILDHFFDDAIEPINDNRVRTDLTLVPCSENFVLQDAALFNTTVQFLVFNEFEQRFSTSRTVDCFQNLPLSLIDTSQPERSIFSAGVAGTVVGQTRLNPLSSGLVGVAVERYNGVDAAAPKAAFNIHFQGRRAEADLVTLP